MPRVHKPSSPSAGPRGFALLVQAKPDADGVVDEKVLTELQAAYGDASASFSGKDELTFDEFCALFARPPTAGADGGGDTMTMACRDETAQFSPHRINRRAVGDVDVRIQVTHASICHSDMHTAKSEWPGTKYPCIPGHEIVGIVTEVGPKVTKFKVGDRAGVGCMVNSLCGGRSCTHCKAGNEQYCEKGMVGTYGGVDLDGSTTYGGYSTAIVVVEDFVLHIPDGMPLEGAAPLLCAGITTFSPLVHYGLNQPGMTIGVVGLGGLGAHATRIAKAMGCKVTAISTSPGKEAEVREKLGADDFILSSSPESLAEHAKTLDGIIDTVSAQHELGPLLDLLKTGGKLVMLGASPLPPTLPIFSLLFRRLTIGGSLIGGIAETQEMLDFCAKHSIILPYETIPASYINKAYERMLKNDVKYRFVIDIQGTLIA
ncbi:hypothetical protein FOA52_002146 [Chlamydomonas sp. UWO 241]|nr:hypothetical protein FOA52_002146 [Chlamydomonas sp. UWO 241]